MRTVPARAHSLAECRKRKRLVSARGRVLVPAANVKYKSVGVTVNWLLKNTDCE